MFTMCDEMWNNVSVYGPRAEIERFKTNCIVPTLADDEDENDLSFDPDRIVWIETDTIATETWNFRESRVKQAFTYSFAFDTGAKFPTEVFRSIARLFPNLAFDCSCIADNDSSMGFGWFNPPPGGEDFRDDYAVPKGYWTKGGGRKRRPKAEAQHQARVAEYKRVIRDAEVARWLHERKAQRTWNSDIPLQKVQAGIFLSLGSDPLLDPQRATYLFRHPEQVIAVHQGRASDEQSFLRDGGMIVRATGWETRSDREISLEMTGGNGGRVLVSFPDDRHLVAGVNLPNPPEAAGVDAQDERECNVRPVVDPASGEIHDGRDLSAYRLPAFWRDASVVWYALPASWIGKPGRLSELLLFEAAGGVSYPAPADIGASETVFHQGVAIAVVTQCWENAAVLDYDGNGRLDPVLEPVLRQLIEAFGSPDALRSAALDFVDTRLVQSGVDTTYLKLFMEERGALAIEVARQEKRDEMGGG